MNAVFTLVFLASAALCLVLNPDGFLNALLAGGQKAVTVSVSLIAVYCVWLAFFSVMKESGLANKFSRLLLPLSKRLFRSNDQEAIELATANLTANFLGLPGAPTPLGIKAVEKFYQNQNRYAADMLFVLNATSLQLIPTTVIALRASYHSASPADILFPTLIATVFSTLLGALLVMLTSRRKRKKK